MTMPIRSDNEKELLQRAYDEIRQIKWDNIDRIATFVDPTLEDTLCIRIDMVGGKYHKIMVSDKNIDPNEYKDQFLLQEIRRVFSDKLDNIRTNSVMLICRFKRLICDSENIINDVYDELYLSYPKDAISFSIIRETVNKAVEKYFFGDN